MSKKESAPSKRCHPREQPKAARMPAALPSSIPPPSAPVTAAAGAGSGHGVDVYRTGYHHGSDGSSSSRSHAHGAAAGPALAPTPTLAAAALVTAAEGAGHGIAATFLGGHFGSGGSSSSRSHGAMRAQWAAASPPPTMASMQVPQPPPLYPPSSSPLGSRKRGHDDEAVLEATVVTDEHKDGSASLAPATRQRTASPVRAASSIVAPTPMLRMLPPTPGVLSGGSSAGPQLSSLGSLFAPADTALSHSSSSSSRSDLFPASALSSTRLPPAVAAKTGYAPRWSGDFAKVPSAIITEIGKHLQGPQYNSFQKTGIVPKRETGMVVLSSNAFDDVPNGCEYISPTETKPGFDMPSNRRTFSFATPTATIPAILRLLDREVPWNITMLTIILYSETLAEDLRYLATILPAIVMALKHVKYIVLVIDGVQFVFSIGRAPGKRSHEELGTENVELAQRVFASFSKVPGGYSKESRLEFCEDLLREFPVVGLHSSGLHSIKLELSLSIPNDLAFCQKIASDPENRFYNRLKLSVTIYSDFLLKPENVRLFPVFSYVGIRVVSETGGPIPLDFSNFDQMVTLIVDNSVDSRIGPVILPRIKGNLEIVKLGINKYVGGLTFPSSEPYDRLRGFRSEGLPASEFPTRFESKVFPALERISCMFVPPGSTLDLSGITKPGLNLDLIRYTAELILPIVELGQLSIDHQSLDCGAIKIAFPTVRDLRFFPVTASSFQKICEILRRTGPVAGASAAAGAGAGDYAAAGGSSVVRVAAGAGADTKPLLTSAVLERFFLECFVEVADVIRMGAFPRLQTLDLYQISTALDGCNFPELDSLALRECDVQITGIFPRLTALKLTRVTDSTHIECIAPMLTELEFTEVRNATNIMIGPRAFPGLRSLHLRIRSDRDRVVNPFPRFESGIPSAWFKNITVHLQVPSLIARDLHASVDLMKMALPGCLLISRIIA